MIDIIFLACIFITSLVVLTKGADFLVDGSADFARFIKISPVIVGLTVVAFGTSMPEFVVSFISALAGNPDIAIGNVIGSNIANIGLIIGIAALIVPLTVHSRTLMYEFPIMLIASFLFIILANNMYIFGVQSAGMERFDGFVLIVLFVIFIAYIYNTFKKRNHASKKEFAKEYKHINTLWKNIGLMTAGIVMLAAGGRLFVYSASEIARMMGVTEAFIALTIVSIGTSLPELFTVVVAAIKKEADIAIGNVVGSNIFNVLFVLGFTSFFVTLEVNTVLLFFDGMIMLVFTLIFLLFATMDKRINRVEGGILLFLYIAYIAYLVYGLSNGHPVV